MRVSVLFCSLCAILTACASHRPATPHPTRVSVAVQLAIGDTFTIDSAVLGEVRRINVFTPTVYGEKFDAPLPVLYMPDGGMAEDFLHVAGLMQVLVSNGGMRPFILVGIENTQRRRDLTGPTTVQRDLAIAPVVGGSAAFRRFIRDELMPAVRTRYRTTAETAIVGESLAGLFVVETCFREPDLFSTYIAIDPSLWWSDRRLLNDAAARQDPAAPARFLYIAHGNEPEIATDAGRLAAILDAHPAPGVTIRYQPFPAESHATIYHPAALAAFRAAFRPTSEK